MAKAKRKPPKRAAKPKAKAKPQVAAKRKPAAKPKAAKPKTVARSAKPKRPGPPKPPPAPSLAAELAAARPTLRVDRTQEIAAVDVLEATEVDLAWDD